MKSSSDACGLVGVALADLPEALVPDDPRLGGACVRVPRARLAALHSSGSVLLGRSASHPLALGFRQSVMSELRSVLRLGSDHHCAIVAGSAERIYQALAVEAWSADLDVRSSGPASTAWREVLTLRPRLGLGLSLSDDGRRADAPAALGCVARDGGAERLDVRSTPSTWAAADLSATSAPLTAAVTSTFDVAFFCPSALFGVVPGCTILALSPRAVEAAQRTRRELAARGLAACVNHLALDSSPSLSDWLMLAHGVRERLESSLDTLEASIDARLAVVAAWTKQHEALTPPAREPGGSVVARVACALPTAQVAAIGTFLEHHHLAYGVVDPQRPDALHVALLDSIPMDELTRLLSLLSLLLEKTR